MRLKTITFLVITCVASYVTPNASLSNKENSGPDHYRESISKSGTNKDEACYNTEHENHSFGVSDYTVLGVMLLVSCAIGTFYGFFTKKATTSEDFLLGGSSMGTVPMSLSLAASFITAIELLGNPAEMYQYGTQFWTVCFAFICVVPITSIFYLPVYMKLRLTSTFEYLEMRFDKRVRLFAAVIYVVQMTLYTSVTVYAPALALSHVTKINVYLAVSLVYLVCVFYSSQGGMKAVIMTDTFQAVILMISLILVAFVGSNIVGGPLTVFNIVSNSSRIELLKSETSLTERHTIWTQVIGGVFYWVPMFCSNQASIQKYLSVEKIGQVRTALWVSAASLILIYSINFYTGMIVFAQYYQCDPLKHDSKKKADEILPFYVMSVLGGYKSLPGLFVAGIFAASLGTVASALNSLAAVVMQDFLESALRLKVNHQKGAVLSKWISVIFGIISFALIFVVERIDSVLKAALTFNGVVGGITLALFSVGMFLPWMNSKGALTGAIMSLGFVLWIALGAEISQANGYVPAVSKPVYYHNCSCFLEKLPDPGVEEPFFLYRISYMWYSAIGFILTVVFTFWISYITGFTDPCMIHPDLLSPVVKNLFENVKEKLHIPLEDSMIEVIPHENASEVDLLSQSEELTPDMDTNRSL